jgi:hypothetical protein
MALSAGVRLPSLVLGFSATAAVIGAVLGHLRPTFFRIAGVPPAIRGLPPQRGYGSATLCPNWREIPRRVSKGHGTGAPIAPRGHDGSWRTQEERCIS